MSKSAPSGRYTAMFGCLFVEFKIFVGRKKGFTDLVITLHCTRFFSFKIQRLLSKNFWRSVDEKPLNTARGLEFLSEKNFIVSNTRTFNTSFSFLFL